MVQQVLLQQAATVQLNGEHWLGFRVGCREHSSNACYDYRTIRTPAVSYCTATDCICNLYTIAAVHQRHAAAPSVYVQQDGYKLKPITMCNRPTCWPSSWWPCPPCDYLAVQAMCNPNEFTPGTCILFLTVQHCSGYYLRTLTIETITDSDVLLQQW